MKFLMILYFSVLWTKCCCFCWTNASPSNRLKRAANNIDWDSFGFGLNDVSMDRMWLDSIPTDGSATYSMSSSDCLVPLEKLKLHPSSTILNYGQGIFEGLKAFRRQDGSIILFRPDKNAARMQSGAERFLMPPPPTSVFVHAVEQVVRSNAHWVPPHGKGALYLRPLLFGSGAALGIGASSECTFCVYCSPVGNYFNKNKNKNGEGNLGAISLQAIRGYTRAAPGGSGAVKAVGNYAPAFLAQQQVRQEGHDEALFLDAVSGEAIEEAGASNFFAVFPNNTIVTPSLKSETILAGVTRDSILELAEKECGCKVVQGRLTLNDLSDAREAFCCGTGASITPVRQVVIEQNDNKEDASSNNLVFGDGQPGKLTQKLHNMLSGIQMGTDEKLCQKYAKWVHVVGPQNEKKPCD